METMIEFVKDRADHLQKQIDELKGEIYNLELYNSEKENLDAIMRSESYRIALALKINKWNKPKTAIYLDLSERTLHRKIKEFKLIKNPL